MKKLLSVLIVLLFISSFVFAEVNINANDLKTRVFKRDLEIDANTVILANASKSITVASLSAPVVFNGVEYKNAIKLSGAGSTTYRAIKLVATAGESVTLLASSSAAASARSLLIIDEQGTEVGSLEAQAGNDPVKESSFTFTTDGTYYLYSKSGGINVYQLTVK